MATMLLSEKYSAELYGVLNCYDRIIITGNVHPFCYAKGMTGYLYAHNFESSIIRRSHNHYGMRFEPMPRPWPRNTA
jgi:hypothetical protein